MGQLKKQKTTHGHEPREKDNLFSAQTTKTDEKKRVRNRNGGRKASTSRKTVKQRGKLCLTPRSQDRQVLGRFLLENSPDAQFCLFDLDFDSRRRLRRCFGGTEFRLKF